MNVDLSKTQKGLLAWTTGFIALAEVVKRMQVEGRAATIVGLVELMLAIGTGIAFGFAAMAKNE